MPAADALPRYSIFSIVHGTVSKDTRPFGTGTQATWGMKVVKLLASLSSGHPEINYIGIVIANQSGVFVAYCSNYFEVS
jgi:hypothetical protein